MASVLDLITANRKKVFVLVVIAAVLLGMEALRYLKDVERLSSVEWLFRPKPR